METFLKDAAETAVVSGASPAPPDMMDTVSKGACGAVRAPTGPSPLAAGLRGAMATGSRGAGKGSGTIDVKGTPVDVNDKGDAGNFYCEYVLHALLTEADQAAKTALVDGDSGPLVGFLHLPEDAETYSPSLKRSQDRRHKETRKVVGAALRGYFEQIKIHGGLKPGEPMRILMTGFEPWSYVKDNPSGDFVQHEKNTTEAMQAAFGAQLDGSKTKTTTSKSGDVTMTYVVNDLLGGPPQVVEVYLRLLPVSDHAMDRHKKGSVPDLFKTIDPHAALSMGVYADKDPKTTTHIVETTADDASPYRKGMKKSSALAGAVRSGAAMMP